MPPYQRVRARTEARIVHARRSNAVLGIGRIDLPVDELPDDALLAGFSAGDDESTVAFVRRFQSKVFGVALAVIGDYGAAEDVAQQAFERVWRLGAVYDARRGSVTSWLTAITRNLAIDATRVRRPVPVDVGALLAAVADGEGPEHEVEVRESVAELRAALGSLPLEQARALVLAGIGGLSASEVAAGEGVPLGTAKTRIRIAMRHVRFAIGQSEADLD